jgi:hypothetical protein
MESGFTFPYRFSFGNILNIYSALFLLLQTDAEHLLAGILKRLCEYQESLLNKADSSPSSSSTAAALLSSPHSKEVHSVIAAAVRGLGLEKFLRILPLDLPSSSSSSSMRDDGTGEMIGTRSWLLPIIQENVMPGTPLKIFIDSFLPIADALESRVTEFNAELAKITAIDSQKRDGLKLMIQQHRTLIHQIWHLFPSFCYCPSDATSQFKRIAKRLGDVLREVRKS